MRNELIQITEREGRKAVSMRELFSFFGIKSNFTDWAKRMFEYGFEEGTDFITFLRESSGGRPSKDYALTIDTAKEISMLQRSEKGKQARRYFIEVEKTARELAQPMSDEEVMIRAYQIQTDRLEAAQTTIEENKPVLNYANEVLDSKTTYTTTKVAAELGMSAVALNRKLKDMRVHRRHGGQWILLSKYQGKGYTKTKSHTHLGGDGSYKTTTITVWTELGRRFVHELLNPDLAAEAVN